MFSQLTAKITSCVLIAGFVIPSFGSTQCCCTSLAATGSKLSCCGNRPVASDENPSSVKSCCQGRRQKSQSTEVDSSSMPIVDRHCNCNCDAKLAATWLPVQHQRSDGQRLLAVPLLLPIEAGQPELGTSKTLSHALAHGPPLRERLCVWRN